MFITEEQLAERLASPKNLANRFRNKRIKDAKDAENDSRNTASETKEAESRPEGEESECIEPLSAETIGEPEHRSDGITFKQIKRPGNCRPWLSREERNSIAIAATESGRRQTEIAKEFGVQPSTVSDIVSNKRRKPDTDRSVEQSKIQEALDKVRERAIDKLMSGLGQITDDKMSEHSAKDISYICANMARVVQQTIPQEKIEAKINLTVYAPEIRAEKSFKTVEI